MVFGQEGFVGEVTDKVVLAAENALQDDEALSQLVEKLEGASRRERQVAAQALALVAKNNPQAALKHGESFVDALSRPEAQTRWECLDVLTRLVELDADLCEKGIVEAETALFDEGSGPLRLAAMRFLCKIGATSEARSEKTWSLIDEDIQCYHGDLEFQDMLSAVVDFSAGKLSPEVKLQLVNRMKFDAANSKGALQRKAQQILENVK